MEAFTTDQIDLYCSKRQRSLRIDDPTASVRFVYAADGRVKTGSVGVVQFDARGSASRQVSFRCVDGGPPSKAWWAPVDKAMYAEFRYLRIEGV